MKRRVFLSTLVWGAATLVVRPLSSMPPPFGLVRARIASRASKRPEATLAITAMGATISSWEGKLEKGASEPPVLKSSKHGELKLDPDGPSPEDPGVQLLAALLSEDPLKAVEATFGGIQHAKNRVVAYQQRSLGYRFGASPAIVVERETWLLVEVDAGKRDGHHWIAHLSYRPEETYPHMIRITKDQRPAITARLNY